MHVLVSAAGDLDFVVYCNHERLVCKTSQPFFGGRGIPSHITVVLVSRGADAGAIREQSIPSIRVVWIELLLIYNHLKVSLERTEVRIEKLAWVDGAGV